VVQLAGAAEATLIVEIGLVHDLGDAR